MVLEGPSLAYLQGLPLHFLLGVPRISCTPTNMEPHLSPAFPHLPPIGHSGWAVGQCVLVCLFTAWHTTQEISSPMAGLLCFVPSFEFYRFHGATSPFPLGWLCCPQTPHSSVPVQVKSAAADSTPLPKGTPLLAVANLNGSGGCKGPAPSSQVNTAHRDHPTRKL